METLCLNNFKDFRNVALDYKIEINNNQLDLFKRYYEILIDWNKKINLISRKGDRRVAPTENDPILEKHFLDSILFLPEINCLCRGDRPVACGEPRLWRVAPTRILDIGSGGGFPAVPLAIMKPEWDIVLCESIKKKANFLDCLVKQLGLKNVSVKCERVENIKNERFDFVTARAIGKLSKLIKYSFPLLKQGGCLLAYKSKNVEKEIKDVKKNNLKIFSKELNGVERKLIVLFKFSC